MYRKRHSNAGIARMTAISEVVHVPRFFRGIGTTSILVLQETERDRAAVAV